MDKYPYLNYEVQWFVAELEDTEINIGWGENVLNVMNYCYQ